MNIYMVTRRGDRTNIMAWFEILDKEGIINRIKTESGETIRYGTFGGYAHLLKDMDLAEYEAEFGDAGFTPEQVTENFKKEISEVYGQHKIRNAMKVIGVKKLKPLHIYKDTYGGNWLYLGKVHRKITGAWKNEDIEGNGFIWLYAHGEVRDYHFLSCDIIKTSKKLVEEVGPYEGEILPEYTENFTGAVSGQRSTKVTIYAKSEDN